MPYAAGLALVSGCGLRLDLPQPAPPVPTRRKVPDEDLLVGFVRDLREIVLIEQTLVWAGRGGPTLPMLLRLHEEQVEVLVGRLTNEGVPRVVIDAPAATTSRPPSSPTATSGGSAPGAGQPSAPATPGVATMVVRLADRLAERSASDWADLAGAGSATRGLLFPATTVRLASAVLMGRTLGFSPTASAARPALAERTAALVYGFEVVAAQADSAGRKRGLDTLDRLQTLSRDLVVPASTSAWALPFPVTTPAAATRLATHLLRSAIDGAAGALGATPTPQSLQDAATWSARVQAEAPSWSVPLTAFPGTA